MVQDATAALTPEEGLAWGLAHMIEAANLLLAEADRQEPDREQQIAPIRQLRAAREQAVAAIERWPQYQARPRPAMRFWVERPTPGAGRVAPFVPMSRRDRAPGAS